MMVSISSDAEADLAEGYWFYERQSPGLGDYFRSCLMVLRGISWLEPASSTDATIR